MGEAYGLNPSICLNASTVPAFDELRSTQTSRLMRRITRILQCSNESGNYYRVVGISADYLGGRDKISQVRRAASGFGPMKLPRAGATSRSLTSASARDLRSCFAFSRIAPSTKSFEAR